MALPSYWVVIVEEVFIVIYCTHNCHAFKYFGISSIKLILDQQSGKLEVNCGNFWISSTQLISGQ